MSAVQAKSRPTTSTATATATPMEQYEAMLRGLSTAEFQEKLDLINSLSQSQVDVCTRAVMTAEKAITASVDQYLSRSHFGAKAKSIAKIEADPKRLEHNRDRVSRLKADLLQIRKDADANVPMILYNNLQVAKDNLSLLLNKIAESNQLDAALGFDRSFLIRKEQARRKDEDAKRQKEEFRRQQEEKKRQDEQKIIQKMKYAERCRLDAKENDLDLDHHDDDTAIIEAHILNYKNNHCNACDPKMYFDNWVKSGGRCDGYSLAGITIVSDQWDCNDNSSDSREFRQNSHEVYAYVVNDTVFAYKDDLDATNFLDIDDCPCYHDRIA